MTDAHADDMIDQIDRALEGIRPYIGSHRGTVEVVDFDSDSGTAFVRLGGTCQGCAASSITLKNGIETRLRQEIPAVKSVEAI